MQVMSFMHNSIIKPLSSHHYRSRNSRSSVTKNIMTKDEEITDDKVRTYCDAIVTLWFWSIVTGQDGESRLTAGQ